MSDEVNRETPLDIEFTRPSSYVVSVRLNAGESREFTAEARRSGEKLSTFIKDAAMETVRRRRSARQQSVSITGRDLTSVVMIAGPGRAAQQQRASSDATVSLNIQPGRITGPVVS